MVVVFISALVAAYIVTRLVESLATALGFVAAPNPLVAQHVRPVPYLGGVGVLGGLIGGLLAAGKPAPASSLILGMALFTLLGLADDVRPFKPGVKFMLQAAIAIIAVATGLTPHLIRVPLADGVLGVTLVLTLVNAVNFTDVCDGLVASIAIVALGAAALVLHPADVSLCLAGSGACAGFLLRNRPPARIFLGDAGSHLIGFLLAAVWIAAIATGDARNLIRGGLLCGVFLFELLFITAVRIWKGLPWWRGSPDHFSLRLQAAGWPRAHVDMLAGVSAGAMGLLAWAEPRIGAVAAVLTALACGGAATAYLLRFEVRILSAPKAESGEITHSLQGQNKN